MKRFFNWFIRLFTNRRTWVRQIIVAAIASATAWIVGDNLIINGGLVAAIVCALSIRISLYKSVREGLGQIVGTAIGAGVALLTVYFFNFGVIAIPASASSICSPHPAQVGLLHFLQITFSHIIYSFTLNYYD